MTRLRWTFKAGPLALLAVVSVLTTGAVETARPFAGWTAPVNLGADVNSAFDEFLPELSGRAQSLLRLQPSGATRWRRPVGLTAGESRGPWGAPVNLGAPVNTSFNERSPALSRDGHLLFFATDRPGGAGSLDIWVSWRAHTHDDFGWQPAVNLGAGVNGAAGDFGPSYFENDENRQSRTSSSQAAGRGASEAWTSTAASSCPTVRSGRRA